MRKNNNVLESSKSSHSDWIPGWFFDLKHHSLLNLTAVLLKLQSDALRSTPKWQWRRVSNFRSKSAPWKGDNFHPPGEC